MDYVGNSVPLGVGVFTAIFIGILSTIFIYTLKWLRQARDFEDTKKNENSAHLQRGSTCAATDSISKHKKEQPAGVKKQQRKLAEREERRTRTKVNQHSWLLGSLKGHGGRVLDMDFAPNGKYLASCSDDDPELGTLSTTESSSSSSFESNKENSLPTSVEGSPKVQKGLSRRQRKNRKRETKDTSPPAQEPQKKNRTVFLWEMKDLNQKDRKSLRVNVDFDYATKVKWSPDCKAVIIQRFNENAVEVYKVEKKKDGWLTASKALTFSKAHETDVIGIGIASTGRYIMTCSNKTDMVIWDLKGEILAKFDNYLMNTTCAKISPCGRFVVAAGFTPEAKVWEVVFDKSGEFKEVKPIKPLTLGGHSSGVYDVAFDIDSSQMATVSKDGTWKIFDTNVNYKQNQDARLIRTGKYMQTGNHAFVALSPNSEVLVIATSNDLQFFSTMTGEHEYTIENISNDDITAILFDASGKYLLVAVDKQILIFHNIPGYKCGIDVAKEKLKEHQTSATKERLRQLIKDNEEFLKKFK